MLEAAALMAAALMAAALMAAALIRAASLLEEAQTAAQHNFIGSSFWVQVRNSDRPSGRDQNNWCSTSLW